MSYEVLLINQANMGCALYQSVVRGDVSFPVNFDKAVEFAIYDCDGGRVLEFELDKIFAPLFVGHIWPVAGIFNGAQSDKRSTMESQSRGRASSEESVASPRDVGMTSRVHPDKILWLTRFGQMWAYILEKVSVGRIVSERAAWEPLTPSTSHTVYYVSHRRQPLTPST